MQRKIEKFYCLKTHVKLRSLRSASNESIFLVLHVMGIRSFLAKPFAAYIASNTRAWSTEPFRYQDNILKDLIHQGKSTIFGRDHDFASIKNYNDFKKNIPIRDYEDLKPYIQQVLEGKADVLWKG